MRTFCLSLRLGTGLAVEMFMRVSFAGLGCILLLVGLEWDMPCGSV